MSAAVMNWTPGQQREFLAQAGTVLAGLLILFLVKTVVMKQELPVAREPISLTLVAPPIEPEKIIEKPQKKVETPKPERVVEPQKVVAPLIAAPSVANDQVVVPVATPPKENLLPARVEAPVQRASNGAAEGAFAQDVRARVERKKIYPETARDLGMSGEVEVLYELDRAGNLLKAEISTSSGFKLLDQAALRAVKSATYQGFPEDAWIGAASKVFRTKLVFSLNQ